MANTPTRAAAATKTDVQLDDSAEHEALTPLMRRLAREYWEMVRARAAEQGLPIVWATLWPYIDLEHTRIVHLVVHFDAPDEQALAFRRELSDEHYRWHMQLDPEAQETNMRLFWTAVGIRRAGESANGA